MISASRAYAEVASYSMFTNSRLATRYETDGFLEEVDFCTASWLNQPIGVQTVSGVGHDLVFKKTYEYLNRTNNDAIFACDTASGRDTDPSSVGQVSMVSYEYDGIGSCYLRGFSTQHNSNNKTFWTRTFPYSYCDTMGGEHLDWVRMSDDGSTVVIALSTNLTASGDLNVTHPQFRIIDGQTGEDIWVIDDSTTKPVGLSVSISEDGSYCLWRVENMAFVYLKSTGELRAPGIDMTYAVTPEICPKGTFVTFGYETAYVYKFVSGQSKYVQTQSFNFNSKNSSIWVVGDSSHSVNGGGGDPDGCLVTFTWYDGNVNIIGVSVHSMLSGKTYWQWESPANSDGLQNMASVQMHLGYVAISSWGDDNMTTIPTTYLWSIDSNIPLVSFHTPGSMFDVDMYAHASTVDDNTQFVEIFVCAAGKAVPANDFGNGGDAYLWRVIDLVEFPPSTAAINQIELEPGHNIK